MDKITDPANGLDFLDKLRDNNQNKGKTFDDLSWFLEQRAREQGVPIHGQFELTPLCNFDCKMCYAHLTKEQMMGRSVLTTAQWKDIMQQAYELGMYKASLTGGECLTYPGFKELYLFLHGLGCEVNVLTNGYLLDEKWIEFFKEHMPAKIQITLYGHDEDSYERVTGKRAFAVVKRNIERIKEADLPLQLVITPNKYMGHSAAELIRMAFELNEAVQVNSTLFAPREETGRKGQQDEPDSEDYLQIYKLLNEIEGRTVSPIEEDKLPKAGGPHHYCEKRGLECGGGRSGFVINWKGIMTPCNRLYGVTADVIAEGVENAWKRINRICNEWPRVPECVECPYEPVCDNCAAAVLQYTEAGKRPAVLCRKTREMVRQGMWRIPNCD